MLTKKLRNENQKYDTIVHCIFKLIMSHANTTTPHHWRQSLTDLLGFCKQGDLERVQNLHTAMLQYQPTNSDAWVHLKYDTVKVHPLRMAAHHGRLNCVQYLLPFTPDPKIVLLAARSAAGGGHWDVIDCLLPYLPTTSIGSIIDMCVGERHWGCVRKLLPHFDFNDKKQINNGWLCAASQDRQEDLVALLYDWCDFDNALTFGGICNNDQRIFSDDDLELMMRHHEAVQQRKRLCEQLIDRGSERKSKM